MKRVKFFILIFILFCVDSFATKSSKTAKGYHDKWVEQGKEIIRLNNLNEKDTNSFMENGKKGINLGTTVKLQLTSKVTPLELLDLVGDLIKAGKDMIDNLKKIFWQKPLVYNTENVELEHRKILGVEKMLDWTKRVRQAIQSVLVVGKYIFDAEDEPDKGIGALFDTIQGFTQDISHKAEVLGKLYNICLDLINHVHNANKRLKSNKSNLEKVLKPVWKEDNAVFTSTLKETPNVANDYSKSLSEWPYFFDNSMIKVLKRFTKLKDELNKDDDD